MNSHHHHHHHGPMSDRRLTWAIVINVLLTVVQVAAGVMSGSLGLIADALHNLSDAASMGIALLAQKIARRPADRLMTFGYQRAELVATLINVTALLLVGGYLLVEAIGRFMSPTPVQGWPVVIVAGVALAVDTATAWIIAGGARHSLNVRAAFLHNVTDALASLGVIAAGTLILLYDLIVADLLVTVAISGYVIYQAAGLLPRTVRLLMGATPDDLEFDAIVAALRATPGVRDIHHVHIWSLDEHRRALEAHLVPEADDLAAFEHLKHRVREVLHRRFHVEHATLEPCVADRAGAPIIRKEPAHRRHRQ
ncbi:MAG TPA: cation transporter [Gammaproteobacteria bacterium]|uniref:cation diffusion facilitator family transporter n=1 Tax=Immundisolibacter sp. TaxID=1934948 RepID=UPI000E8915CC|nr:cation transporter [Gammaproteobacteria bacterium]HCZ48176.1 cation transporter [Gammaproteobacteria bacterium]MCH77614.1 cation transporter [Gammaproteobacteria bacterium]